MDPQQIRVFIFIGVTIVILLLTRFFVIFINRGARMQKLPPSTTNGLKVIIRLISFLLIILMVFILFDVSAPALISISSVGGIFIGFASSEVMSQIVSGLYLISARPFGIHDLVSIDDLTGLVMEIGLNYTILQKIDGNTVKIPNKMILDSNIKNYTIKLSDEIKKRQSHLRRSEQVDVRNVNPEGARKGKIDWKKLRFILDDLTDFAFEKEITRFVFDFDADFSIPPDQIKERLDAVCKMYQPIFEHLPQYKLMNLDFRPEFQMIVYCYSPFIIVHNYDAFIRDIGDALYSEVEIQ